jgi:4-hydroxy-tetrahydrodipicolinate reductase
MIKVAVAGASGRMGRSVIRALSQSENFRLVVATESPANPNLGRDAGELCGMGNLGVTVESGSRVKIVLRENKPEVLVDFTNAEAAVENSLAAASAGVNLVIGTTGFSDAQQQRIAEAVKRAGISAVISPNMATGVNVFFKLARDAARVLRGYEVEIIEAHHRYKKDSPSGTALKIGALIAKETGRTLDANAVYGRKGMEERTPEEIGFHSIRAGDIVGEHMVLFAGDGERIEITHRAHGREAFAIGVLRAIDFIHDKKDGRIYSTWDVLGID